MPSTTEPEGGGKRVKLDPSVASLPSPSRVLSSSLLRTSSLPVPALEPVQEEPVCLKITIKNMADKTFELDVKSADTIESVKQKVQDVEGIPPDQQRLIADNSELENHRTIEECGLQDGAVLDLLLCLHEASGMYIRVKTLQGRVLELQVESSDTITSIKQKLHARAYASADRQRLFYAGKELDETFSFATFYSRTLADASITSGSTIHLAEVRSDGDLFIQSASGLQTHEFLLAPPTTTIAELKLAIQKKGGIPSEQQRLIFADRVLRDGLTLANYNIIKGSTLRLLLHMKITINHFAIGNTMTLYVDSWDTIATVKQRIEDKDSSIPSGKQWLLFAGKNLDDSRTLGQYNIAKESTLFLALRNDGLQLFVKTLTGKLYTCYVQSTDTVETLKQRIQNKTGMRVDKQRLISAGHQLQDSSTIAECNIVNDTTVHLVPRL